MLSLKLKNALNSLISPLISPGTKDLINAKLRLESDTGVFLRLRSRFAFYINKMII